MTTPSQNTYPYLAPNTIVPSSWDLFIPYFNRLYEDISFVTNQKDDAAYPMPISSTPTNIVNMSAFGAYIVCVSGQSSELPTLTASLCKSDKSSAGSIAILGSQVGSGAWAGFSLTITSSTTSFQIAHDNTGVVGSFFVRIVGTQ